MVMEELYEVISSGGCEHVEKVVSEVLSSACVESVVAGISGGADSVAMLRAMLRCGVRVTAVHCDFHLRGDESERDRMFVEDLCRRLDVKLHVEHFDTESYRREHGLSVEEACRDLRYALFRRLMRAYDADRIAVAHNAGDQAETLLLNLMRGSGVSGLRAMLPDTGEIIRPLLSVSRTDILKYLDALGQPYVTDSTNLESEFARNFMRNDVLPLLAGRWPHVVASLNRTSAIMAQSERVLEWAYQQLNGWNRDMLLFSTVASSPDPLWLIGRFARVYGLGYDRAAEMLRTFEADGYQSGHFWECDGGRIYAGRDRFEFVADGERPMPEITSTKCPVDENVLSEVRKSPLSELWTALGPDEILFRHPRISDRISPLGMDGSVLVSKVMKDAKLSEAEKRKVVIAEAVRTGEVIWVAGLKRSRHSLVSEHSTFAFHYHI